MSVSLQSKLVTTAVSLRTPTRLLRERNQIESGSHTDNTSMVLQCPMPAVLLPVLLLLAASASTFAEDRKTEFTAEEKKEFVLAHNRLRQAAYPTAGAMNLVTWNCQIEERMMKAARKCTEDHTGEVGENYFQGNSKPTEITNKWYSEIKFIDDHFTGKCNAPKGSSCGHYTQVMTEAVTEIGCGIHWCTAEGHYKVYCGYNAGNGFFSYGAQCSNCSQIKPLCLHGLCVSSKDMTAGTVVKDLDSTATAKSTKCKLVCQNCGTRVDNPATGECKCNCKPGTSGDLCENGKTTDACSPCKDTPLLCQNGGAGREHASDKTKCACTCTGEFVGEWCEFPKADFDNSVKIALASRDMIQLAGKDMVRPPVSRALFNSKIWPALRTELSNAVNAFCREKQENFVQCCPGKTFPGASKVASAAHISDKDVDFTESSVKNSEDGSLTLFVHAKVSSSALCVVTRKKRSAAKPVEYVKKEVLIGAIKAANSTITDKLKSCCENVALKDPVVATLDTPHTIVIRNKFHPAVQLTGNGTYNCGSFPMPPPTTPKGGGSTLLPWPLSLLLLLAFSLWV